MNLPTSTASIPTSTIPKTCDLSIIMQRLQNDFPAIAQEVSEVLAKHVPSVPSQYRPEHLELYFDDVVITESLKLPINYHPEIITIYGDGELLLAFAYGALLLNRLPEKFAEINKNWREYHVWA